MRIRLFMITLTTRTTISMIAATMTITTTNITVPSRVRVDNIRMTRSDTLRGTRTPHQWVETRLSLWIQSLLHIETRFPMIHIRPTPLSAGAQNMTVT